MTKLVVSVSLVVTGLGAAVWGWFLAGRSLGDAASVSGVLQGFGALLAPAGLVFGLLALRGSGGGGARSVVRGDVTPGRDAYIAETMHIDQRRGAGEDSG